MTTAGVPTETAWQQQHYDGDGGACTGSGAAVATWQRQLQQQD